MPLKQIELLCLLFENRGDIVTKSEILDKLWADSFVEESNLSRHVYLLRKTLKNYGADGDLIENVARRGYRFTDGVSAIGGEFIIEKHSLTRTLIEEFSEVSTNGKNDALTDSALKNRVFRLRLIAATVTFCVLAVILGGWRYYGAKGDSETSPVFAANQASFDDSEKILTDFGFAFEKAWAVAVQPDGKFVLGGWAGESLATADFAIARFNADGTLDSTFDGDGKIITSIGKNTDIIYAISVQPDGKIVAAGVNFTGTSLRRFCIVRYKADGALDASFDGDGIVTLNIGTRSMDTAYAVAVQPDGKIVVAGSAYMLIETKGARPSQNDFGLVRLNEDGTLDATFGDEGKVVTNFGYGGDVAYSLALQTDGKIVAAGTATNGMNQDFALARYNADGSLDKEFGAGGKVRTDFFDEDDLISAISLQPDGKIVAAGYAVKSTLWDFAAARYAPDGSLDNSFNGSGKLTTDIKSNDVARAVAVMPDGRIIVSGMSNYGTRDIGTAPEFALVRLLPDGILDTTFNSEGKISTRFQTYGEAFGMALLPGGDALIVGAAGDGKTSDFAFLRVKL